MNSEIIIREAITSDINAMVDLLKLLFATESDFVFNKEKQRQGLEMILTNAETRCIMVAEATEGVIGMCSVQTIISTSEGGQAALIEDMVVQKAFQGQGIGKQLLTSIEQWCSKRNIRRIQLLADTQNQPALDFYKRMDWQRTQLICLRKFAGD